MAATPETQDQDPKHEELSRLILEDQVVEVRMMLDQDPDLQDSLANRKDHVAWTGGVPSPLHAAVCAGSSALIRILVEEFGCNVNVKQDCYTKLSSIAAEGETQTQLVPYQPPNHLSHDELTTNPTTQNPMTVVTPLHLAILMNKTDLFELLLSLGANIGMSGLCNGYLFTDATALARQQNREALVMMMTEHRSGGTGTGGSVAERFNQQLKRHPLLQEELKRGKKNLEERQSLRKNFLKEKEDLEKTLVETEAKLKEAGRAFKEVERQLYESEDYVSQVQMDRKTQELEELTQLLQTLKESVCISNSLI